MCARACGRRCRKRPHAQLAAASPRQARASAVTGHVRCRSSSCAAELHRCVPLRCGAARGERAWRELEHRQQSLCRALDGRGREYYVVCACLCMRVAWGVQGREREWIEADGKIVLERQCGRTGRHIGLACKRASRMLACDLAREPADRVIVLRVVFGLAERRAHLRRGRPQLKSVR